MRYSSRTDLVDRCSLTAGRTKGRSCRSWRHVGSGAWTLLCPATPTATTRLAWWRCSGRYLSGGLSIRASAGTRPSHTAVSYTHLRAHETRHDLVCRLLLEKKKK